MARQCSVTPKGSNSEDELHVSLIIVQLIRPAGNVDLGHVSSVWLAPTPK